MILTQTTAMLVDAYRELNSKKMFWISLILSALVVASIACVGINNKGLTVLWWTISLDILNTSFLSPASFYKFVFIQFGFNFWLAWIASILALISTASIIPDLVAGGSIELSLSKPIARVRLFLTKYATALLFTGLQVGVFTLASFLVIGIRGGSWEWSIFLAIPLVLLFFSFIYCVCALLGLITRSTIAALLLSVLFWFFLFLLNTSERTVLLFKINAEDRIASAERELGNLPELITRSKDRIATFSTPKEGETDAERLRREANKATEEAKLAGHELRVNTRQQSLTEYKSTQATLDKWHGMLFGVKSVFPKTAETMGLLERQLTSLNEFQKFSEAQEEREDDRRSRRRGNTSGVTVESNEPSPSVARKVEEVLRSRSVFWVLGTSVMFEALVLFICCAIFVRRDF
jgi:ABC-type transport system involved in multi-copper enzyme maturation permease subunit